VPNSAHSERYVIVSINSVTLGESVDLVEESRKRQEACSFSPAASFPRATPGTQHGCVGALQVLFAGGIHGYLMFASTHALSTTGRWHPFDAAADSTALTSSV